MLLPYSCKRLAICTVDYKRLQPTVSCSLDAYSIDYNPVFGSEGAHFVSISSQYLCQSLGRRASNTCSCPYSTKVVTA